MATWLDVKNNIAAGGVVLENNEVFNINTIFGSNVHGYYFSYAPFFAPEINLTDNDHQNNFKTIKFKDPKNRNASTYSNPAQPPAP